MTRLTGEIERDWKQYLFYWDEGRIASRWSSFALATNIILVRAGDRMRLEERVIYLPAFLGGNIELRQPASSEHASALITDRSNGAASASPNGSRSPTQRGLRWCVILKLNEWQELGRQQSTSNDHNWVSSAAEQGGCFRPNIAIPTANRAT